MRHELRRLTWRCAARAARPNERMVERMVQAADRIAAFAAEVRADIGDGVGEAARADHLHLLRSGDDDRADADTIGVSGSGFADCRECVLIT